jgi:hypothetical protein
MTTLAKSIINMDELRKVVAKGSVIAVFIAWNAQLQYRTEVNDKRLYEQMNGTLKEATKAMTEFNMKNR